MEKTIRFTSHAIDKLAILKQAGFPITEFQVTEVIRAPDLVDRSVFPPIAQKAVSEKHVLRVVFVEEETEIRIITLYPGRRIRYEDDL